MKYSAPLRAVEFPQDLHSLTSIRFVLALGVVLFHYSQWWNLDLDTGLIERSRLGVDVFFILSGFVLTHVYGPQIAAGRYDHGKFLVARAARVYPLHLLMLLAMAAMVVAAQLIGSDFAKDGLSWSGFLQALLLVHAWIPMVLNNDWNGPSWSLSAEWFAYLAFPLYAWLGYRLKDRPAFMIAFAGAAFLLLDAFYRASVGKLLPQAELQLGIMRIVPEFLYGVALYRLGQKVTLGRQVAVLVAILAGGSMVLLMHMSADDRLIVAMAGPLVLSLALLSKARAEGALSHRWLVAGGEASYALYMVHFPIIVAWKNVVAQINGGSSDYLIGAGEMALMLGFTLTVAFLAHFLFEVPVRALIRDFADRRWRRRPSLMPTTPGTNLSQPPRPASAVAESGTRPIKAPT